MFRLGVSGTEEAVLRDAAPRLRGTMLVTIPEPQGQAYDAAAFVGSGQLDPGVVERLLQAGKHVLLATEACLSSDVLQTLSRPARQHGVQLAVVNPERFLPSRQLIRQQLDGGQLGTPQLVRSHRWEPLVSDSLPQAGAVPAPLLRDLELTLFLFGQSPRLVYAVEQSANERSRFVQVHLGFSGGGMALLDHAAGLPSGDAYGSLSVIGSAGAAYADDHQNMQLVYRGGHPQAVRTDEGIRQLTALLQHFVDTLLAGPDTSESVTTWQRVWNVAAAVQRSLSSRQAIALEDG